METVDLHPQQGSMFGTPGHRTLYFLTNQKNLMAILGAGMVVPAGSQFRYREDSREQFSGAIPLWKGAIPPEPMTVQERPSARAVVIEFEGNRLSRQLGRTFVWENEEVLVLNAPVPIRYATAIYMQSATAVSDFLSRIPGDVVVDPSLLKSWPGFPQLNRLAEKPNLEINPVDSEIDYIDRLGGAIRALEVFSKSARLDSRYIQAVLEFSLSAYNGVSSESYRGDHSGNKTISSTGVIILSTLLPLLRQQQIENGIDGVGLAEELAAELDRKNLLSEDLRKWLTYLRKILDGEKEVPPLTDEGDVIKRAVLLYLLRPSVDRLSAAPESPLSPGPRVFSIAVFLGGFAHGLLRMPGEYKGAFSEYFRFVDVLVRALWGQRQFEVKSTNEEDRSDQGCISYEINGELVLRTRLRQEPLLALVVAQAKVLGYNFQYDYQNDQLVHDFAIGDSCQQVFIEIVNKSQSGVGAIRFLSPCLDLSGSKLRSLTKKRAIEFLQLNETIKSCCSFAYSSSRDAMVVQATQLVKTMDDDELELLLSQVATTAFQCVSGNL